MTHSSLAAFVFVLVSSGCHRERESSLEPAPRGTTVAPAGCESDVPCAESADCPPGHRCNHGASPASCHLIGCGVERSPCSDDALCSVDAPFCAIYVDAMDEVRGNCRNVVPRAMGSMRYERSDGATFEWALAPGGVDAVCSSFPPSAFVRLDDMTSLSVDANETRLSLFGQDYVSFDDCGMVVADDGGVGVIDLQYPCGLDHFGSGAPGVATFDLLFTGCIGR